MAGAVRAAEANQRWGPLIAEGVAGLATTIIALSWPTFNDLFLVYLISGWALVTGILEIVAGLRLRRYVAGEWLLTVSGIASIILGFLMVIIPLTGAITIAYWVGLYAFLFGALLIALGFRLRTWVTR
jgi:uncharacterized membrane protein HdeD (DUF308 family)